MKLWDKGIPIDQKIEKFTVGNDRIVDLYLAKYDLLASLAHAKMLKEVDILDETEYRDLEKGLSEMLYEAEQGDFSIEEDFEDVHSKIEHRLIEELGEVGKKIHTARSRNDQVLVALQLYYKESLHDIFGLVEKFFNTLLNLAEQHKDKLLPGYTHLQVAMPSSFGLWFSAYAEVLIDDMYVLQAAYKTIDQNPLGSAAGYGSSFPIDRQSTTKTLNFSTLKFNVVAAQLGRGKNERTLAMCIGGICNTLARFAMDICLYNSQNYDFISFPDQLTTGSSIMPHKKNPDVFELIRGKCNKIQAIYTETLLITNNLPSGYHRDFQLMKENIINAIEDVKDILDIFNYAISQCVVKNIDLADPKYQHLFTVDNINSLVENGMSFREAYQKVGKEVADGSYVPNTSMKHSHIGSRDDLALDKIRAKFPEF